MENSFISFIQVGVSLVCSVGVRFGWCAFIQVHDKSVVRWFHVGGSVITLHSG